ncbi:unnamed protein product [Caenorhabditis nigoni]
MKLPFFLLLLIIPIACQLHDMEMTTQPSWAPTGRLNQFNGFATPRPSLLPANAQMVYASVWAAWSAWSFCSDSKRIRVRACNTVRGFRCLGPNQQTEACDPSTSPILGRPPKPNTINDYDTVDPWQEDRVEALKQLYPDESIDEKLNHLPDHEKERLRARLLPPPTQMSHELLNRPGNERDGAPGATPERLFGARALGSKSFAVPNTPIQINGKDALKFPELLADDQFFSDITNAEKSVVSENQNQNQKLEDFSKIEDFQASVDAAENQRNLEEFEKLVEEHEIPRPPKNRGEGTFSAKKAPESAPKEESESSEMQKLEDSMDGPQFREKDFKEDVFGSIEELMTTKTTKTTQTTTPSTTTRTTTTTTTTTTTAPTTTTTTPTTTTTASTTRRPPTRVTPRLPTVIPEDHVELVTPTMVFKTAEQKMMSPEVINFFEEVEHVMVEQAATTRKPWKNAIHYGEVFPRLPFATLAQAPPTQAPPPTTTTPSGFPIPEEISLDTLHALDWMLANMTKAAEEGGLGDGNELRLRLDSSSPNESIPASTKLLSKKPKSSKKSKKNRVKTHRTKVIQLHYGEVNPAENADRKFPKFRNRNAHRAKIFGIKTSSIPEDQLKIQTKKEELVDEINDLRDLMEQMDERIESRSALMEENFDSLVKPKHEHDSPYRHRQV